MEEEGHQRRASSPKVGARRVTAWRTSSSPSSTLSDDMRKNDKIVSQLLFEKGGIFFLKS